MTVSSISKKEVGTQFKTEYEYWFNKLKNINNCTYLPYSNLKGSNGEAYNEEEFKMSSELYEKLICISGRNHHKLFIILSAGVFSLLQKYSECSNIIIGTTILKQNEDANYMNSLIFLFSNIDARNCLKDILMALKDEMVLSSKNQNVELNKVFYNLGFHESGNMNAVSDVALLLENIQDRNYLGLYKPGIIFRFSDNGNGIKLVLEYDSGKYHKVDIIRYFNQINEIFNKLVNQPESPINEFYPDSEEKHEFLVYEINKTDKQIDLHVSIDELIKIKSIEIKNQIAIDDYGKEISYGDLWRRVEQIVVALQNKGVKKGDVVGIFGERSADIIAGMVAILHLRAVFLPINGKDPYKRIKTILNEGKASCVITSKNKGDIVIGVEFENVLYFEDITKVSQLITDNVLKKQEDTAYIIFTSGTTGIPKGVQISHAAFSNYVLWAANEYITENVNNIPFYSSIAFDFTITSIFVPLITGRKIIIYNGNNENSIIKEIFSANNIDLIKITPSHLMILRDLDVNDSRLTKIVVGGESFSNELARKIYYKFGTKADIFNEYGPTEATVGCNVFKYNPDFQYKTSSVSIGKPISNMKSYVLDKDLSLIPIGGFGEIYVSGLGVTKGYVNSEGDNAKIFVESPFKKGEILYRTGDKAKYLPDGNIEFYGRFDDQVKIRGNRVELCELQNLLLKYDEIEDLVIDVVKDNSDTSSLILYYVANKFLNYEDIKNYIVSEKPDYFVPSYLKRIEKIPINSNGKIDKNSLKKYIMADTPSISEPENEVELKLLEIFYDTLGLQPGMIGIDNNFFEFGGHSLNATLLTTQIHKEFDIIIPLIEVFKNRTVRNISKLIQNNFNINKKQYFSIKSIEKAEYYPLSSAQRRLFIVQTMFPESTGYNVTSVVRLIGNINIDKFKSIFQELVMHHDSLKTSFHLINNNVVQKINNSISFDIQYHEMEESEVHGFLKDFVSPYKLQKAPLMDAALIKVGKENYILAFDIHHIITDGISQQLLINELCDRYNGKEFKPLRIQYKDYCKWQIEFEKSNEFLGQEKFWMDIYKNNIPKLNLPYNYPYPKTRSFDGEIINFDLEKEYLDKIYDLVKETDSSMFIVLLSVYYVLLHKVTGQNDLVVGSPITGRRHNDLQRIVGMFINMLSLRCNINSSMSFVELIKEVKEKTFNAFENQEYQFEQLTDALGLQGTSARNPIFDTVIEINYENKDEEYPENLKVEKFKLETKKTSVFDLIFTINEKKESINFKVRYPLVLFKRETIMEFIDSYKKILTYFLDKSSSTLGTIKIKGEVSKIQQENNLVESGDFDFEEE